MSCWRCVVINTLRMSEDMYDLDGSDELLIEADE